MKYFKFVFFLILFNIFSSITTAQPDVFLNPGLKLGYTFGNNAGFHIGAELSITVFAKRLGFYGGPVFSLGAIRDNFEFHIGLESGWSLVGADAGIYWLLKDGELLRGYSIQPYAGFLFIPFVNFVYLENNEDFHQAGIFLKCPIQIGGEEFRGVGG